MELQSLNRFLNLLCFGVKETKSKFFGNERRSGIKVAEGDGQGESRYLSKHKYNLALPLR